MKIAYISSAFIPSRSAYSVHVMKMCQALAQAGHDVTLVTPHARNYEPGVKDVYAFYGVKPIFEIQRLLWLQIKGGGYVYGLLAGGWARKNKIDFVYGRFLSGCYFSTLFGLPVGFEVHAPIRDAGKLSVWFFKRLISRTKLHRIISISEALRKDYLRQFHIPENKIIVAADAADKIDVTVTPVCLCVKDERLQIGYVGHLYQGKGMELISRLLPLCPWADFNIVGGMPKDIAYWKSHLAGCDNIRFHGFVPNSETSRYLLAFDIVLAPYMKTVSVHGGKGDVGKWMSPLKIFEYMAAGRPMVCSDLPVLHEVLQKDKTALFCSSDNVKEWVEALMFLRDDSSRRRRLGTMARTCFEKEYSWAQRALKVLAGVAGHGITEDSGPK